MNTCWKCAREVPEGKVECDYECSPMHKMSEEDARKFERCLERIARRRRIDWGKVKSAEDLILVIGTLFGDASVDPDSETAKKLGRFLVD